MRELISVASSHPQLKPGKEGELVGSRVGVQGLGQNLVAFADESVGTRGVQGRLD